MTKYTSTIYQSTQKCIVLFYDEKSPEFGTIKKIKVSYSEVKKFSSAVHKPEISKLHCTKAVEDYTNVIKVHPSKQYEHNY